MKIPYLIGAVLIAMTAAACSSAPVQYHSLIDGSPESAIGTNARCCHIGVVVKLLASVDRPELVVRRSDQLLVLTNDVWIASLRDEIGGALSSEVRRRLPLTEGMRMLGVDEPITIHADVERFESVLSRYALIQIAWRVAIPGRPDALTASCETVSQIEVRPGVSALVQGHQQALIIIGDQMVLGILRLMLNGENRCS